MSTAILNEYVSGALSWREACIALGLWDYSELQAMLESHSLSKAVPLRDARINALLETVAATLEEKP